MGRKDAFCAYLQAKNYVKTGKMGFPSIPVPPHYKTQSQILASKYRSKQEVFDAAILLQVFTKKIQLNALYSDGEKVKQLFLGYCETMEYNFLSDMQKIAFDAEQANMSFAKFCTSTESEDAPMFDVAINCLSFIALSMVMDLGDAKRVKAFFGSDPSRYHQLYKIMFISKSRMKKLIIQAL